MLKRFWVNNFKSLLNFEFKPAGLNLLIGPNNAGKTNLCAAMRFLGLTVTQPLATAIRTAVGESWNISNAYVEGDEIEMQAECALPFRGAMVEFRYHLVLGVGKSKPAERQLLYIDSERLEILGVEEKTLLTGPGMKEAWKGEFFPDDVENTSLNRLSNFTEARPEYHTYAGLFRRFLSSFAYFSFNVASLRAPAVARSEAGLLSDGANLSRTLFVLHNENPRLEKKIIETVRLLEPKLDFFTYSSPDPESVYLFMEDSEGHRFSTQSLSDGTLRYLAMTYLVFAAASASENGRPSPLIIIEEPENGLYVRHLKPLLERIDLSGKAGQFIFTSHNPYFIDLFDDNLDGLHLIKPGKPSSVLTKPNPEKIRKLLEHMPLGEQHFREMLG